MTLFSSVHRNTCHDSHSKH